MIVLLILCLALAYPHGSEASDTQLQEARALLTQAKGQDKNQGFAYQATYMRYYEVGDSLLLQGQARISHKGAELEAAEIVFRRDLDQVEARAALDSLGRVVGRPVLRQGEQTLRGERILYDLSTEQGTILEGKIHRDKGFYAGRLIQTRSSTEFHVHQGSDHPHFDFYSPRIKVIAGDMAVARPVYFRIKERRLLWIPFYVFSLREDRQSGILTPSFGQRALRFGASQSEWELRNLGYYIAPNDYWDLSLATDLRQRSGWLGRARLNYAARYRFRGHVSTGRTASRNWRLEFRHSQELGRDASLRADGTFQSNNSFAQDNSTSLQDRLNRTLRSNLSYSRRWRGSGNSFSLKAGQTKYLDTERFSTILPELSLRKSRKPIWGQTGQSRQNRQNLPWYSRVYYDGNASLRNTQSGSRTDTTSKTRAQVRWGVSAQYRPFSWLNLSPALNQDWSDQDLRESATRSRRRDRFSTRAALSQTFYGLFSPSIGSLQALRHVLKPSLSFNYQASRADTGGVFGFGGDGSPLQHRRTLNLRLDNTFWAKILRDDDEHKVRLVQLNFSTAYDFEEKETPLDDLRTTLSVEAGRYLNSRLTLRHEFYDEQNRLHLLAPRREQLEVRTSASWSRRSAASREETGRTSSFASSSRYGSSSFGTANPYGSSSFGSPNPYGSSSFGTANPYGSSSFGTTSPYGRESFGFESGLMRDIDTRRRGSRLQLSHYISHRRATTTTSSFIRSWVQAAAGFSLASWHCNYSLNYNLRVPGKRLLTTERLTSELLSLQKEFHDWTATLNVQPSTFHKNRAFFLKVQLKDIPQLKLERGQRRFYGS
ncbi:MAG: hypothetical protein J4F35_18515 [Candidatus Latescibacteria bacterium]|nr:hypothetical protein [Candidatus Latescibacterota bacterium]